MYYYYYYNMMTENIFKKQQNKLDKFPTVSPLMIFNPQYLVSYYLMLL